MVAEGETAAAEWGVALTGAEQVALYWQRCCEQAAAKQRTKASVSLAPTDLDEDDCDDEDDDFDEDLDLDDEMHQHYVRVRRRSPRSGQVSGLPLLCHNCGVSFFSLRSIADESDCYCSGECKWSVIMYREMDRRMHSLRSSRTTTTSYVSTYDREPDTIESSYHHVDEVISCR
ncbi:hypothetical protein PINS_up000351 [Pythium insidiosum]|nr:hypothetical protein PINS_up000351 [Pythium insidiosum]